MSDLENEKEPDQHGMVRKTRRVRKKRRREKSSEPAKEDATTLFSRAKELLIGMHDEDDDYGPIDVAEQVRRLKKKKDDERPLDDVWGTKRRSTSWLWIVLSGAIVSVLAIIIGLTRWANEEQPSDSDEPLVYDENRFAVEDMDLAEGPLGWFNNNSLQVLNDVDAIIEQVNEVEEVDEFSKLLRDSPFRSFHPVKLEDRGSEMLTDALAEFQWSPEVVYSSVESGSKERGYLKVSGLREDRSPYEAYFVVEDDHLVLDWDATQGWSEMPLPRLIEEKPRKPMLMRCRITKRPSFDQQFGTTNYSGYVLSGDVVDTYVFAYLNIDTPRGKAMDRELRNLLNYGRVVTRTPPKENVKATLRVGFRETIGEDGEFEIVEFLHDGWVTP